MEEILTPTENSIDYLLILDIVFKAATICIAGFNAFFAVKIFKLKDKKDETEKEKDRKIQLLKTLVLDHNLKNYHLIFERIESDLSKLQTPNLTDTDKQEIDAKIGNHFIDLRSKFYDSLLAIDDTLYDRIKKKSDALQTLFTETIFDQGVNLAHLPKYDELIIQPMTTAKTEIIKALFTYRG
jgi:hypothetical protein